MSSTQPVQSARVEAILRAALRVIARDGANGVRMAVVAEQAGVSKALVHYYFSTRRELLRSAFAFSAMEVRRVFSERFEVLQTGRDKLSFVLLSMLEQESPGSDFHEIWNELWSSTTYDAELRPIVEEAYREWVEWVRTAVQAVADDDELRPGADPETTTWHLAAVADGVESMLVARIIDHERGRRIVLSALAQELRP